MIGVKALHSQMANGIIILLYSFESWHGREVDLVHGFPFVSEVFFLQESDE